MKRSNDKQDEGDGSSLLWTWRNRIVSSEIVSLPQKKLMIRCWMWWEMWSHCRARRLQKSSSSRHVSSVNVSGGTHFNYWSITFILMWLLNMNMKVTATTHIIEFLSTAFVVLIEINNLSPCLFQYTNNILMNTFDNWSELIELRGCIPKVQEIPAAAAAAAPAAPAAAAAAAAPAGGAGAAAAAGVAAASPWASDGLFRQWKHHITFCRKLSLWTMMTMRIMMTRSEPNSCLVEKPNFVGSEIH